VRRDLGEKGMSDRAREGSVLFWTLGLVFQVFFDTKHAEIGQETGRELVEEMHYEPGLILDL
jgi:hypothetical protein